MFSQNVVEPRDFITEPGIWDSQQNSQMWGSSQTTPSQLAQIGSNSQYRNSGDLQVCRPWKASNGSDYWSQSQNQSQQQQENEDASKYHLRYLNKPPLFASKEERRSNDDKGQTRALQQFVELQRKKSFDNDTRAKLEQIVKMLYEFSEEVQASVGDLKSELGSEFSKFSEKWHASAIEIRSHLEKVTENIKVNFEDLQKLSNDAHEKSKIEFQQLAQLFQALGKQHENILEQLASFKKDRELEAEKQNSRNESVLQEILSHVARKPPKTREASIQTSLVAKKDESTQEDKLHMLAKETQTEGTNSHSYMHRLQLKKQNLSINMQSGNVAERPHLTCNSPVTSTDASDGTPFTTTKLDPARTQISKSTTPWQQPRAQPLSSLPPNERMICFPEVSSPVATVSPIIHAVNIKQENTPSNDPVHSIVRRPKRRNPAEKKGEQGQIFMFDFCSDLNDSEEATPASNIKEHCKANRSPIEIENATANQTNEGKPREKFDGALSASKLRNAAVQKDITSYGKIRKHAIGNWAKKASPWKSPTNLTSVSNTTPKYKASTRQTARETIAQKRKEYAESVFCFDDYADLKQIQLQFQSAATRKSQPR